MIGIAFFVICDWSVPFEEIEREREREREPNAHVYANVNVNANMNANVVSPLNVNAEIAWSTDLMQFWSKIDDFAA